MSWWMPRGGEYGIAVRSTIRTTCAMRSVCAESTASVARCGATRPCEPPHLARRLPPDHARDRASRRRPRPRDRQPARQEQPLWIPSLKALAFGDAVIETGDRLRVWEQDLDSERRTRWYRERFIPTLKPLLDLRPERVLVTHGAPVLSDGNAKLASALRSKPWNRRSAASA